MNKKHINQYHNGIASEHSGYLTRTHSDASDALFLSQYTDIQMACYVHEVRLLVLLPIMSTVHSSTELSIARGAHMQKRRMNF